MSCSVKNLVQKNLTFIKYVALQLGVYALDLLIFAVSLVFFSPQLSQGISKFLCGFIAFFGQKFFVFETSKKADKGQATKYFLLWSVNIPVTALLVGVFYAKTGHAFGSKIAVDILAFVANYFIAKTLIFHKPKSVSEN